MPGHDFNLTPVPDSTPKAKIPYGRPHIIGLNKRLAEELRAYIMADVADTVGILTSEC